MRSILACLLLAATALAAPALARADNESEARALFLEGVKAQQQGDNVAALDKYERAYALFPAAKILLNMGTTLRNLGRNAQAADTYEKYLAAKDADPKRAPEVRKILAELDGQVGHLQFQVSEPDADVVLDGKPLTVTPETTVRVDPGSHSVIAEKAGFERAVVTLKVSPGEERTVELKLEKRATGTPHGGKRIDHKTLPVETPAVKPWYSDWVGWSLAGAGAGLLIGSGIVQTTALSLHDDAVAALTPDDASSIQSRAESRQTVALVLGGLGVAALAAGVVKLVVHDHPVEAPPAQTRLRVRPGGLGVVLEGTF